MELFYNYFKKIKNNYLEIYENITDEREFFKNTDHNCICIPCNFSFCHNDNKIQRFVEFYDKLMSVDTEIVLSYSTDGLYAIDNREKNLTTNQEFYDKVFKFCANFGYNCHPMIAPENIDNAIDNYEWWKKMYKKYFSSYNQIMPCMLEVRNEGWTQEKINKYIEFLEYLIQDRLKIYNNNVEIFTKMLFTN